MEPQERTQDQLRAVVQERKGRILAEIASLGPEHPWAGRYSTTGGLTGTYCCVSPREGCLLVEWGCLGIYDVRVGPVVLVGDRLRVAFEPPEDEPEARMRYAPEFILEGAGPDRCLKRVRADGFELVLPLNGGKGLPRFEALEGT